MASSGATAQKVAQREGLSFQVNGRRLSPTASYNAIVLSSILASRTLESMTALWRRGSMLYSRPLGAHRSL